MKRVFIVFLVALLSVTTLLILTGCSSDDNGAKGLILPDDLKAGDADFAVMFLNEDFEEEEWSREAYFWLTIMKINPNAVSEDLSIKINGEEVELDHYFGFWSASYELNSGDNYNIELMTSNKNYQGTVRAPYLVSSVSFPESFDGSQAVSLTWQLANNNQYQYVFAGSSYWDWEEDEEEELYSEYSKKLNPGDRQHTIPANSVENFGEGTYFDINLTQMNRFLDDKLAIYAFAQNWKEYDSFHWRSELPEAKKNRAERLLELVR